MENEQNGMKIYKLLYIYILIILYILKNIYIFLTIINNRFNILGCEYSINI